MRVLAVANQKGGVGKTTTAVTVGHWFTLHGYKVLMIDLDGQGHAATALGMEKEAGIYRWLAEERPLHEIWLQPRPNLFLVANDHMGEVAKEVIRQANFREYVLANAIDEEAQRFDLVVIDTPPSTDLLHILALVASDYLIIPANMDYLALDGVLHVRRTVRTLDKYPGVHAPTLLGVLPTMFDRQTNETMENVKQLQELVGGGLVLPPVMRDTKLREASAHGQTIWEYAPMCAGAIGFEQPGVKERNSEGKVGGYLQLCEYLKAVIF